MSVLPSASSSWPEPRHACHPRPVPGLLPIRRRPLRHMNRRAPQKRRTDGSAGFINILNRSFLNDNHEVSKTRLPRTERSTPSFCKLVESYLARLLKASVVSACTNFRPKASSIASPIRSAATWSGNFSSSFRKSTPSQPSTVRSLMSNTSSANAACRPASGVNHGPSVCRLMPHQSFATKASQPHRFHTLSAAAPPSHSPENHF